MAENVTKIPVKIQEKAANVPSTTQAWAPGPNLLFARIRKSEGARCVRTVSALTLWSIPKIRSRK